MSKLNELTPVLILVLFSSNIAVADDNVIDEILVTAQKREQSAQDVPIAISVFGEDFFDKTGSNNVTALIDYTPGFTGTTTGVSNPAWGIRGAVTNDAFAGSENSVGVFQDEAYIGRDQLAAAAFFDVERIEVLKGPQGSLFGRNTLAGAVSITSKKPGPENTLDVLVGAGNEGQRKYSAIGNLALSDRFALRAAIQYQEFDGIDVNIINGKKRQYEDLIGRVMARWNPTDSLEIAAMWQASSNDNNVQRYHVPDLASAFGEPVGTKPYSKEVAQGGPQFEYVDTTGINLRITWDVGESMQFTSISDFRDFEHDYSQDIDGISNENLLALIFGDPSLNGLGGINFSFNPKADTFAQEFRLNGSADQLEWMIGVSYFKEEITESNFLFVDLPIEIVPPDQQDSSGETESLAVYADVTWEATENLTLTAGLRANRDEKVWNTTNFPRLFGLFGDTAGSTLTAKKDWDDVSPRFVVHYSASDNVMFYGSWSKGFKAGGFNALAEDLTGDGIGDAARSFDPEELAAFELGTKLTAFDGSFSANAAIYKNDYTNLQVETIRNAQVLVDNAAEANVEGLELELTWLPPINGLALRATYAFIDSEYEGVIEGIDVSGNQLNWVPENSATVSVDYIYDMTAGTLGFFVGYIRIDEQFFDAFNSSLLKEDSYSLLNGSIQYTAPDQKWDVALIGSNLTDEKYSLLNQDPVGFGVRHFIRAYPRLYMLQVGVHF